MLWILALALALLGGLLYQLLGSPTESALGDGNENSTAEEQDRSDPAPSASGIAGERRASFGDAGPDAPAPRTRAPAAGRVVSTAPAAIPSSISQEKDPTKRAKLMKMHRLATARVRVALLDRRRQMLRRALERAKANPTAASTPARDLERQLARLEQALKAARKKRGELEPPGKTH